MRTGLAASPRQQTTPSLHCHALLAGALSLSFEPKHPIIMHYLCQAFLCSKDKCLGVHLTRGGSWDSMHRPVA